METIVFRDNNSGIKNTWPSICLAVSGTAGNETVRLSVAIRPLSLELSLRIVNPAKNLMPLKQENVLLLSGS